MYDVIIVGAGASGMVCGIEAGRAGRRSLILEQKEKPGKKLYATGNGKCNYGNRLLYENCFRSVEQDCRLEDLLFDANTIEEIIQEWKEIGVYPKEREGYIYPRSEQAQTVVNALVESLDFYGVEIKTNTCVQGILKQKNGFKVKTNQGEFIGKNIVLANGGKSQEQLGSDGSGYGLAKSLGHTITPCYPALCGLQLKEKNWNKLQGVRAKANVELRIQEKQISKTFGELQFTNYGLSGIVIFNLAHEVAQALAKKERVTLALDYFPDMEDQEVYTLLQALQAQVGYRRSASCLAGLLPEKLMQYILERIKLPEYFGECNKNQLWKLVRQLKAMEVLVHNINDYSKSQVTAGGVSLQEISIETMESKKVKHCYIVGELLDVDGICGGYNLMWAVESGRRAGRVL